jgi:hypothetical protein
MHCLISSRRATPVFVESNINANSRACVWVPQFPPAPVADLITLMMSCCCESFTSMIKCKAKSTVMGATSGAGGSAATGHFSQVVFKQPLTISVSSPISTVFRRSIPLCRPGHKRLKLNTQLWLKQIMTECFEIKRGQAPEVIVSHSPARPLHQLPEPLSEFARLWFSIRHARWLSRLGSRQRRLTGY